VRGNEGKLDVLGDLHIGDDKVELSPIRTSMKSGLASVDIGKACSD